MDDAYTPEWEAQIMESWNKFLAETPKDKLWYEEFHDWHMEIGFAAFWEAKKQWLKEHHG
jgi:hypothetical protein